MSVASLQLKSLRGPELQPFINDVGRLRITVFREFPYLYDGDLEYEEKYLQRYINSDRSLVVLAFDQSEPVAVTTCIPLDDESSEFKKPFQQAGFDLSKILYFGESLVLPSHRGQKIGHEFFNIREAHSKQVVPELAYTTFCAVERPVDHPLRPTHYQPLDRFWTRMGYKEHDNLTVYYSWKDIDKSREDPKPLKFWLKHWGQ